MGGKIVAVGEEMSVSSPPASSPEPTYSKERLLKGVHHTSLDTDAPVVVVDGGFAGNGGMSMADLSSMYEASTLVGGLEGMSLNSGDERDSAPEGIAANHQQTSGAEPLVNGLFAYASSEMVKRDYTPPLLGQVAQYNTSQQQSFRGYEPQRLSHEHQRSQPPNIVLPDQTRAEKEFGVLPSSESDTGGVHHVYGLPAYLVVPPSCQDGKQMVLDHNGKQVVLDPNAREYTPSQSLCASPVLQPGVMHLAVPTPYHVDQAHIYPPGVDVGQPASRMLYSPDYTGWPLMPFYCNGSAVGYAPATGPQSPATWEHLGMHDILQHQGSQGLSGLHASSSASGLGQSVHSHPLQPFGSIQPFMSVGFPTMAASGNSLIAHPTISGREHVSRALLLNGVPSDMDELQLKREMEVWGPVRAMGMERRHEGLVTVHFYDLRHTKDALTDIQQQHLWHQQRMQRRLQRQRSGGLHLPGDSGYDRQDRGKHVDRGVDDASGDLGMKSSRGLIGGKVMWAQYTSPVGAAAGPDALNQGTLVVFNLDANMSLDDLRAAFEKYGTVKELRETPAKKLHKFVEFYDVRDAARALEALDDQEIGGKRVKIEFSRPGGQAYKARWSNPASQMQSLSYRPLPAGPQSPAAGSLLMGVEHSLPFGRAGGSMIGLGYSGVTSSGVAESLGLITDFGRENNSLGGQRRDGLSSRRKRNMSAHSNNSGFGKFELMQQGSGGKAGFRDSSGTGKSSLSVKLSSRESVPLQYMFDEGELQPNESPRTTLMIKNIPNKYSQAMLLQLLDRHCLHCNSNRKDPKEPESAYDFVYLPIDFKNRCNLGYAFVNFTTVEATKRLYKAFHAQQWEAFNSRKICQVTYARVQGRVALEEHFRNSRFACDNDEYLPRCFSPPRRGITSSPPTTLTAAQVVGRTMGSSSGSSREEQRSMRAIQNADVRVRGIDENTKRVSANGNNGNHEQEMEQPSGMHGRVLGGGRSNGPQQQQQQQQNR
ncbi:unnamed protein product [Sphagnum jensenii]|uniref:RRM domain-containing protein n=1 Tax=Sphagnum jensenii TaxID=128206 RepID=A0ABP0VJT3_9BRYO